MKLSVVDNILIRSNANNGNTAIWCLPGFADSGAAFSALYDTEFAKSTQIITPDLPGFGSSPVHNHICTIKAYVTTLLELINKVTPEAKLGFVGHSVGSILAVEAALKLDDRCKGVFSIEGNLTAEDAYFSGQAVNFNTPQEFKNLFINKIWTKGENNEIFRTYFSGLKQADATAMWRFGKDVKQYSSNDFPGEKVMELNCPFLYFWCLDNTPVESQNFLIANKVNNTKITQTSHWPMIDAPELTEKHLSKFFKKEN
jgi:pimeloyl-ACP methyl ester carboxylesterase